MLTIGAARDLAGPRGKIILVDVRVRGFGANFNHVQFFLSTCNFSFFLCYSQGHTPQPPYLLVLFMRLETKKISIDAVRWWFNFLAFDQVMYIKRLWPSLEITPNFHIRKLG
jgi:hypothetical protein